MQVLLRDYQMHPWKQEVLHVDFQRVDKNRKIHMRMPLHFVNAEICPGVKTGGGVVQHIDERARDPVPARRSARSSSRSTSKNMELNDTLHVNELAMPKGVEPVAKLKHENPAVVSVHVPKEIVIEEEAAAPVTEIIGEVPAEGEAAAEAGAEGEKKEAAPAAEKKEPAKKE